ncbi:MAG TPA: hypothetical protein VFK35_00285 [Candidatus Limnocylindrales bacterium]|nr:hypothetical protein [Candidatus Limnocylindrales bacterium]
MTALRTAPSWAVAARDLVLVAMAVFAVNIAIGILNGADAVEFDRNQILTHVHAGTVGWLTLSIVASAILLFRAADRRLVLALATLVPIYVVAFYTGSLPLRALGGTALLVAIAWLVIWTWQQFLAGERSLPRLAVTLGISSFAYGALLGTLIQVSMAAGVAILPGNFIGAHASAMTFGYLVLVAFGLIEWRLAGTRDLPTAGLVQVVALFVGGLIISVGLLAGAEQAAGGLYLVTQLVAVVLFVVRVGPRLLRVGWLDRDPLRHAAVASIWVVGALLLFMYLVFSFITAADPTDPAALPLNVLIASDHAVYIGVITNLIVGLLSVLVLDDATRRSWVPHVIFWGINLGLLVFVVGLIVDTATLKRIGAPLMGLTLYVALAILAMRAWRAPLDNAESDLA